MDSSDTLTLQRQAIQAALSFNWDNCIKLNKKILDQNPDDTDCLNRLARAYFETGRFSQSRKYYSSVLEIDPYNSIAAKNLKKLSAFKKDTKISNGHAQTISPALFLEEPGVTTVVNLVKLAEPQKLSLLSPGLEVTLSFKNHKVAVVDGGNNYLGVLPDDTSHLLLKLLKGGNKYQSVIKSVKSNNLSILIRETCRSKKFKNQPSFIGDSKGLTFPSDHLSLSEAQAEVAEELAEAEESVV